MKGLELTVWREVDFTLVSEECIAFSLRLELRSELLGGDLGVRRVAIAVVGIHVRVDRD